MHVRVPEETETLEITSLISDISDLPVTTREERVPTEVKEELTTDEPNEVADKTSAPSILYVCPEATSKLSSVFSVLAADLYSVVSALADPEDHFNFPPASITKFGVALLDGAISTAVSAAVENFLALNKL